MNLHNMELLIDKNFIGGQWVDADDGSRLPVLDPANGQTLASVPLCGASETRRAIAAADAAWPAWRALTAKRRSQLLQSWFKLIIENADDLAQLITADPVKAVASGAVFNFVQDVEVTTRRVDAHLTDIMVAQDFHDLTGQVVAKVVNLANDLETQLVKLLVQAAPPEQAHKVEAALTHSHEPAGEPKLDGPVVNAEGRTDVVANQSEVDDLLASLGF